MTHRTTLLQLQNLYQICCCKSDGQFCCCKVDSVAANLPFVFAASNVKILLQGACHCKHGFTAINIHFEATKFCSCKSSIVAATANRNSLMLCLCLFLSFPVSLRPECNLHTKAVSLCHSCFCCLFLFCLIFTREGGGGWPLT